MLITTTTTTALHSGADLVPILTAGALPTTHAASLPTSRRRHLLPTAQWAHLATDGLVIAWDHTAAARLTDLLRLHTTLKPTWSQLGAPTPPVDLLTAQPGPQWTPILQAWEGLQPWRSVPPLWAAARVLATTTPSPAHA